MPNAKPKSEPVTTTKPIRVRRWAFAALVGVTISATLCVLWVPVASTPIVALLTAIFGGWLGTMLLELRRLLASLLEHLLPDFSLSGPGVDTTGHGCGKHD